MEKGSPSGSICDPVRCGVACAHLGLAHRLSAVQGAIPWLLVRAKSTEGAGTLAGVNYIQRVDTAGGVAPSEGCDAAHAGAEAHVDDSANYGFYGAR